MEFLGGAVLTVRYRLIIIFLLPEGPSPPRFMDLMLRALPSIPFFTDYSTLYSRGGGEMKEETKQ